MWIDCGRAVDMEKIGDKWEKTAEESRFSVNFCLTELWSLPIMEMMFYYMKTEEKEVL